MKTLSKLLTGLIVIIGINSSALAQQASYGSDPDQCKKQLSYLKFGVEGGDMDAGLAAWRTIVKLCPQASPNVYGSWGTSALEYKVENAKDADEKAKYVDTLMMNYDYRLQYFPQRFKADDVAMRKAVALINYAPERYEQIISLIEKYLEVAGDKADASMIPQMFQQTKLMFEKKMKTTEDVMDAYDKAMAIIDAKLKNKQNDEALLKAKGEVEGLFITIPELSSCENLIAIYEPRFKANPSDKELLNKIVFTLQGRQCQESQLFSDAAEALYKVDPNEKTAMALVTLFILKGDYEKAILYINNTLGILADSAEKSKLEVQLATIYLNQMNSPSQALKAARAALVNDPNNANAQLIVASVYARMAANASCGEFDSKAVFWVVVDSFNKAKQLDPSIASDVNKSINQFSQYFPSKEDIFMNGLAEGASYTVSCGGISATTTIRGK
jgi:tetratricopeptide (TPR) repeat protein